MAITRSTWIDDDGTGTTGTILNNAELQKIYTNIDADAVHTPMTILESTATGTQHNFNPTPGIVGATIMLLRATVTITGFQPAVAPYNGQLLHVTMVGAGLLAMTFPHENPGSNTTVRLHTQATTMTFTGYWAHATFRYLKTAAGGTQDGWLLLGGANGHAV